MYKFKIGPKQPWQKEDCIKCEALSTQAVHFGEASVRCCEKPECVEWAKMLALASVKAKGEC